MLENQMNFNGNPSLNLYGTKKNKVLKLKLLMHHFGILMNIWEMVLD
jgi:hypothetical protein